MEVFRGLFGFALEVTTPIYFWLFHGGLVYRLGRIPEPVLRQLSLLVFRAGLPVVLFFGAVQVDYRQVFHAVYVLAGFLSTVAMIGLGLAWARFRGMSAEEGAIFTQGAYRANLNVIGVALCAQAFGEEGLALAALPVALLTIFFNVVAVVLLGRVYSVSSSPGRWLLEMCRNPLIVGISLGAVVSIAGIELPFSVRQAGSLFSVGLLPMALMCIGASLDLGALRSGAGLFGPLQRRAGGLVPFAGIAGGDHQLHHGHGRRRQWHTGSQHRRAFDPAVHGDHDTGAGCPAVGRPGLVGGGQLQLRVAAW